MFDFIPQEYEKLVNIIFLIATALIAHHGITYKNPDGEKDFVRLLFGLSSQSGLIKVFTKPFTICFSYFLLSFRLQLDLLK